MSNKLDTKTKITERDLKEAAQRMKVPLFSKPGVVVYGTFNMSYIVAIYGQPDIWVFNETQAVKAYNEA